MSMTKEEKQARKKAAKKASQEFVKDATDKKTSRTKLKALAKLKERQEREAKRGELYESLAKNSITQAETQLLKSSSKLGKGKASKKERLAQALREERAGIKITDATGLVVGLESEGMSARKRRKMEQERALQEEEESSSDDMEQCDGSEDGDQGAEAQDVDEEGHEHESEKEEEEDGSEHEHVEKEEEEEMAAEREEESPQIPRAGTHSAAGIGSDSGGERKKTFYVTVNRIKSIQEAREKLPMYAEEQPVMEAVRYNDVVVLCGATGSGKSTQLPQFLYEAGYAHDQGTPGMIGCTQPRRVAAVTTAKRVAKELNVKLGSEVGYQVQYEKRTNKSTKIKFMTDGILLKELQSDILLSGYSAIIVDEAHERGLNSDILIGMLSRIVPMRRKGVKGKNGKLLPPLKLIIMSATLRVSDFAENEALFPTPPPVVDVPTRQHPVTIHFNRRTPIFEYLNEAYKKACKIHKRLPGGGILIFLTGRREIDWMCRKLREDLKQKRRQKKHRPVGKTEEEEEEAAAAVAPEHMPVASQDKKDQDGAAGEGEEGRNKEGFLFGEDDGADSGLEDGEEEGEGDDADDEEEEEGTLKGEADKSDEEDVEDLPEEEYDLSESEEEEGVDEEEEEEGGEDAVRTITLDADELNGRKEVGQGAGEGADGAEAKKPKEKIYVKRRPEK